MQVKIASSQTSAKPQAVLIHDSITIPQMTTKTITVFVDHLSEWNTTSTVTTVEIFTETTNFIISSFNFNYNRQKGSSQSNQHNGITL